MIRYFHGRPMVGGRHMVYNDFVFGGGAEAPDYDKVAEASEEAARISAELGREQLAESKRQYDQNFAVAQPVVRAQAGLMDETARQGKDYYDYMVSRQRPVEDALNYDAMGLTPAEIEYIQNLRQQEQQAYQTQYDKAAADYQKYIAQLAKPQELTFDLSAYKDVPVPEPEREFRWNEGVVVTNQADIDAALATNARNASLRDMAGGLGGPTTTGAAAPKLTLEDFTKGISRRESGANDYMVRTAAAADRRNQERAAAQAAAEYQIANKGQMGQLMRTGLRYGFSPAKLAYLSGNQAQLGALQQASMMNQARTKEKATGWAKKLDVAGLYRGMPGASQGAYGLALGAGDRTVQNQMAPGNAYMAGMGQAAGTTMQGQGLRLQGLGNVLDSQTSYANNSGGALGGLLGLGNLAVNAYGAKMFG